MPPEKSPAKASGRQIWLEALLFASFLISLLSPVGAIDIWWYLAAGERFWTHGGPHSADPFSFTFPGARWINHEWLFHAAVYALHRAGGFPGIVALKSALILGALWFQRARFKAAGLPPLWRAASLAVAFMVSRPILGERAIIVSLFLLSWLVTDLERWEDSLARGARLLLWPFLFAVWANSHGGFALGLAVLAAWLAASAIAQARSWRRRASWAALCAAATLVNPYGASLHLSVLDAIKVLPASGLYEWVPTSWRGWEGFWACLSAWAAALAALTIGGKGRSYWPIALPIVLLASTSARQVRHVPLFMICGFPQAAIFLARSSLRPKLDAALARGGAAVPAAAACALILWIASAAPRIDAGVDPIASRELSAAADFIERNAIKGPFYNEYGFGSYLLYRFRGNPPVFIDNRLSMVAGYDALWARIREAKQDPNAWKALLEDYRVRAALIEYPAPSDSPEPPLFRGCFPRKQWALVYWDDLCLIYLRRDPENLRLIGDQEFKAIEPEATRTWLNRRLSENPALRRPLKRELGRNISLHPGSRRARALLDVVEKRPASLERRTF